MSKADMNELFARMGREPELVEAPAAREARRARIVGTMRELHVRLVHEPARGFGPRRRVHVLLVAATVAVAGAAFAGAAGVGPVAGLQRAWLTEHGNAPAAAAPEAPRATREAMRTEPAPPVAPAPPAAVPQAPALETLPRAANASTPPVTRRDAESQLEIVNRTFADAKRAKREGRDAEALVLFEQLLARFPRSVLAQEASVERMRTLVRLGRAADAQRAAHKYLARYPKGFAREEAERLAPEQNSP